MIPLDILVKLISGYFCNLWDSEGFYHNPSYHLLLSIHSQPSSFRCQNFELCPSWCSVLRPFSLMFLKLMENSHKRSSTQETLIPTMFFTCLQIIKPSSVIGYLWTVHSTSVYLTWHAKWMNWHLKQLQSSISFMKLEFCRECWETFRRFQLQESRILP